MCSQPWRGPERPAASSLPACHVPPTVTALEEQTGDMTPAGRCMLNQTEPGKASAETDGNKEQDLNDIDRIKSDRNKEGKTGDVPPCSTLRSSLSSVAPFLRKRMLHQHLASVLSHSKTLHSLTPGLVSSHLLLFALLETVLREK